MSLLALERGLSEAQAESLRVLNPDNVTEAQYAPFKGCSQGLFEIAPGWSRLQLTRNGLALRAHILGEKQ